MIARQQGRGLADLAAQAGTPLVAGSSLKAALDLDWDDPAAHDQALALVLDSLDQFEAWLEGQPEVLAEQPAVRTSLAATAQVRDQDVVLSERGTPTLREGVAPDRRISLEDSQMRHGRKSRSQLVDGYKRHVLRDLDSGLVPDVNRGCDSVNLPRGLDAGENRHVDVHQHDVGPLGQGELHRLAAVAGLTDHLDVRLVAQQLADARANHLVIVGHHDADLPSFHPAHSSVPGADQWHTTTTQLCGRSLTAGQGVASEARQR